MRTKRSSQSCSTPSKTREAFPLSKPSVACSESVWRKIVREYSNSESPDSDNKPPWHQRKQAYLQHLHAASPDEAHGSVHGVRTFFEQESNILMPDLKDPKTSQRKPDIRTSQKGESWVGTAVVRLDCSRLSSL